MEIDTLFQLYTTPGKLAAMLVKVFGSHRGELVPAAERWVLTFQDPAKRSESTFESDWKGELEAIWTLLSVLPRHLAVPEFDPFGNLVSIAREEFTPPDFPGTRSIRWHSEALDAAVSLAPVRDEFSSWSERLVSLVHQRSDRFVFMLAGRVAIELPELAYAMVDAALTRPSPPGVGGSFWRHGMPVTTQRQGFPEPRQWNALRRYGSVPHAQLIPRDWEHLAEIPRVAFIGMHFDLVFGLLHNGKPVPDGVLFAAQEALNADDALTRLQGIALLARFDSSRDEAIQALVRWADGVDEPRIATGVRNGGATSSARLARDLDVFGHGLFHGHGWGREKQRVYLAPLAGALLRHREWSLDMWRALLGPPLMSHPKPSNEEIDVRVRDIIAQHFYQLALKEDHPTPLRKAAIHAIGQMGAYMIAKDLGRFARDPDLRATARQAQQRLRDLGRVSDAAAEVLLDLGVRSFLEAVS